MSLPMSVSPEGSEGVNCFQPSALASLPEHRDKKGESNIKAAVGLMQCAPTFSESRSRSKSKCKPRSTSTMFFVA